ncbi:MAG: hypothetical protein IPP83_07125 [Flavobacteriales bacterium]|nr:hypothetical protein [Flavobacteriales bacterium]
MLILIHHLWLFFVEMPLRQLLLHIPPCCAQRRVHVGSVPCSRSSSLPAKRGRITNHEGRKYVLIVRCCSIAVVFIIRLFWMQVVDDSGRPSA